MEYTYTRGYEVTSGRQLTLVMAGGVVVDIIYHAAAFYLDKACNNLRLG